MRRIMRRTERLFERTNALCGCLAEVTRKRRRVVAAPCLALHLSLLTAVLEPDLHRAWLDTNPSGDLPPHHRDWPRIHFVHGLEQCDLPP